MSIYIYIYSVRRLDKPVNLNLTRLVNMPCLQFAYFVYFWRGRRALVYKRAPFSLVCLENLLLV